MFIIFSSFQGTVSVILTPSITFKPWRQNFALLIKKFYELYFGCVPHICCVTCVRLLTRWMNVSHQMPFAIPMVWREPKDHTSDCYISLTNKTEITSKSKHTVKYPDFPFAVRFVPHSEELPVSKHPENLTFGDDRSDSDEDHGQQGGHNVDCNLTFEACCSSSNPIY